MSSISLRVRLIFGILGCGSLKKALGLSAGNFIRATAAKAYDSDPLDEELRRDGIEMIAPHRSNRHKPAGQDGRRFRR